MEKIRRTCIALVAVIGALFAHSDAAAGPITFNTALPVSRGEFLFQETLMERALDDGTSLPAMDVTARGACGRNRRRYTEGGTNALSIPRIMNLEVAHESLRLTADRHTSPSVPYR